MFINYDCFHHQHFFFVEPQRAPKTIDRWESQQARWLAHPERAWAFCLRGGKIALATVWESNIVYVCKFNFTSAATGWRYHQRLLTESKIACAKLKASMFRDHFCVWFQKLDYSIENLQFLWGKWRQRSCILSKFSSIMFINNSIYQHKKEEIWCGLAISFWSEKLDPFFFVLCFQTLPDIGWLKIIVFNQGVTPIFQYMQFYSSQKRKFRNQNKRARCMFDGSPCALQIFNLAPFVFRSSWKCQSNRVSCMLLGKVFIFSNTTLLTVLRFSDSIWNIDKNEENHIGKNKILNWIFIKKISYN